MNKPELVKAMAEKTGLKKKEAEAALKAFVDVTEEALKKGDKVTLIGFGTFATRKRAKRTGVNPKTGKKIKIPAKVVPFFKPGKKLRETVAK
jgi:DNA-binding protein HU-beta